LCKTGCLKSPNRQISRGPVPEKPSESIYFLFISMLRPQKQLDNAISGILKLKTCLKISVKKLLNQLVIKF